jgi:hypothetical protein
VTTRSAFTVMLLQRMADKGSPYTIIGRAAAAMLTGKAKGRAGRREDLLRMLPPLTADERREFDYHFWDGD